MPFINSMKENLSGMYWEREEHFQIPIADSSMDAIHVFTKNTASTTWNCLSALERNPASLGQIESILRGQAVSEISAHDIMQIKNYSNGIEKLISILTDGSFNLDERTASRLHHHVGNEEALTWGQFRNSSVAIGNVDYIPPDSNNLHELARNGFDFLTQYIKSPQERAIALFLFMARNQFFHDGNKRTASLMMNGCLLQNSVSHITILNKDSEQFHIKLTDFYNTGNATTMMQFFKNSIQKMYPMLNLKHKDEADYLIMKNIVSS